MKFTIKLKLSVAEAREVANESDSVIGEWEGLAAQAEDLRSSIAFFKGDNSSTKIARTSSHRTAPTRPTVKPTRARACRPDNSVAGQQAPLNGFYLDMSMGGPDSDDADFRESA